MKLQESLMAIFGILSYIISAFHGNKGRRSEIYSAFISFLLPRRKQSKIQIIFWYE